MTNELQEQDKKYPHPNFGLRRLGAAIMTIVLGTGLAVGINIGTHVDTVSAATFRIPNADPEAGILPGEVTHEAVCAATSELVDTTTLPNGITEADKQRLKDSCVDAANEAIEADPDADITGTTGTVKLEKNWLGDYSVAVERDKS